ncbi:MAG: PEP-CTERM sorting domain-containing protein [Terriglobales bacterium]
MRRVFLLALLALALPTFALADSITDYEGLGTSGAGTATMTGTVTSGGSLAITTALTGVNGVATTGTISWTTGSLTGSGSSFTYTGGTLTITSGVQTLFSGTFSTLTPGTVTVTPVSILISGVLANGGGTETITLQKSGAFTVSADIGVVTTPEPGTLGLIGTGLIGLAGLARRKLRP